MGETTFAGDAEALASARPSLCARLCTGSLIIAALLLLASILSAPSRRVYDETYHLARADAILQCGILKGFRDTSIDSAIGPLHPLMQLLTSLGRSPQPLQARLVNFAICMVAFLLLGKCAPHAARRSTQGLMLLAIPLSWPVAGLALSEAPTLLAFVVFLLCSKACLHAQPPSPNKKWFAVGAGLAMAASILARQLMIVCVAPVVLVMLVHPKSRLFGMICCAFAIAASCWYLFMWGGMLPPNQHHLGRGSVRIDHMMLGLGYAAIGTCCLSPRWLTQQSPSSPRIVLWLVVGGAIGGLLFPGWRPAGGYLSAQSFLNPMIGLAPAIFIGMLGIFWIRRIAICAWSSRDSPYFLLLSLLAIVLALSPAVITHQFSSRYVMLTAPPIFIIAGRLVGQSGTRLALNIFGTALGFLILQSYYR